MAEVYRSGIEAVPRGQMEAARSLGMSISDTIPPYAGGRSWQGQVLSAVGALAFVAAILLALVPGPRRMPLPAASAA